MGEEILDKARTALASRGHVEWQVQQLKYKQELEEASIKLHSEIEALHQQLIFAAETSDKQTWDLEIAMATLRGQVEIEVGVLQQDLEASQAAERQATAQGEALRRELEMSKQELEVRKDTSFVDKARA